MTRRTWGYVLYLYSVDGERVGEFTITGAANAQAAAQRGHEMAATVPVHSTARRWAVVRVDIETTETTIAEGELERTRP